MEVIGFIAVAVFIFLFGWVTGNIVEWILNAHYRRVNERQAAERNLQMFLERQRADRE